MQTAEWAAREERIRELRQQQQSVDNELYALQKEQRAELMADVASLKGRVFCYRDRFEPKEYQSYELILEVDPSKEDEGEALVLRVTIDKETGCHEVEIMRRELYQIRLDCDEVPLAEFQKDAGWLFGELAVMAGL